MSFCSFRERCKSRNHNNKHFESPSVSAAAVLKISTFQRVQITTGGLHSLLLVSAVVVEAVISSLSLSLSYRQKSFFVLFLLRDKEPINRQPALLHQNRFIFPFARRVWQRMRDVSSPIDHPLILCLQSIEQHVLLQFLVAVDVTIDPLQSHLFL